MHLMHIWLTPTFATARTLRSSTLHFSYGQARYTHGLINPEGELADLRAARRCRPNRNIVTTLNPPKLDISNYIDISDLLHGSVQFISPRTPRGLIPFQFHYTGRFPLDTRGYLYYHSPRHLPPTAGEVRFRLMRDETDPSAFAHAKDLTTPSGSPWRIPLAFIAKRKMNQPLRDQLLQENLVTEAQLETCQKSSMSNYSHNSIIIHKLDQEFPVQFGKSACVWVFAGGTTTRVRLQKFYHDERLNPSQPPHNGLFPFLPMCCTTIHRRIM